MADVTAEIADNLKKAKLIIGTDRTIKALKNGKVKRVFVSKNCPQNIRDDLARYSGLGLELVETQYLNDELGTLCKKPFSVSIIGVLRNGKEV